MQKKSIESDKDKLMSKKKLKAKTREKGITLIALVITIIVLLILAGITINSVIGSKGILNNAKKATTAYTNAEAKEKAALILQEYEIQKAAAEAEGKTPESEEDFLKRKKDNGDIDDYKINGDGTPSEITIGGNKVPIIDGKPSDPQKPDNGNNTGSSSGSNPGSTGGESPSSSGDDPKPLTNKTPAGTKVGTTANIDGQTLDWYLFDVSDDGKTAYLVSTPTYWVPDTEKEVSGAWVPKLVSSADYKTGAMQQAIQKKASGDYNSFGSYTYQKATYTPSENTLNYFKSVNSDWAKRENGRSTKNFSEWNENEQAACYLADAEIFAGIYDQVNKADGNLKGKIQTLVGAPSVEQWCKAYNKQSAASRSKITCKYSTAGYNNTTVPGYIYQVNGMQSTETYNDCDTGTVIFGNDIYGGAANNNDDSSNPFDTWWFLASPSTSDTYCVCNVRGFESDLSNANSWFCDCKVSLFASVAL